METLTMLQIIWFVLVGVLLAGYAVLDGFDLGIGSMLPLVTSGDEKKTAQVFKTIGPVWDGNEVWLITAGGALFAAFPHAYATVFSGFYLALMIVLLGLILRAVSIEFFILEETNKRVWATTFFIGSLIPSILFGVALGNVIVGIPLDGRMEFTGSFFTLLRPFPLVIGILGLAAILMQGATYLSLKTTGEVHDRAVGLSQKIWYLYAALFVAALALSFIYIPASMSNPFAWASMGLFLACMVLFRMNFDTESYMMKFVLSSVSFVSLWGIAGAIQFPVLVKAAGNAAFNITIYNASSGRLTLSVMLGIALVGMPLVIGYTIYVYRMFRGKIEV